MNYNPYAMLLMYVYRNPSALPEQKIQKMHELFYNMSDVWEEDLRTVCYSEEQLPYIKGVEVKTKCRNNAREYIMITEYPRRVEPKIQKTIMRMLGEVGGYECEKWGIGQMNHTQNRHFAKYRNAHPEVDFKLGSAYGYPKVFTFEVNTVYEAPNESYSVMELMGIVLS